MSRTTNSHNVTPGHEEPEKATFSLSVPQVAGGALASVTTAFAASLFGVAGTLFGAALGSVLSSIATVVFGHSLIKAQHTFKRAAATAPDLAARMSSDRPTPPDRPGPSDRSTSRRPAWRPLVLLAGCVFLIAMAAIWVTEVTIGHPISGGTGKGTTSINQVIHGHAKPSPSPSSSESASTSDEPSTSNEPSSSGSGAPADDATSPAADSSQAGPGPSGAGATTG